MAKLIPTVALISVLLVIIANASFAYTTATTTVEVDDTNPSRTGIWSPSENCRQELEGKDLSACLMYVAASSRTSTDKNVLEMPGEKNQQERQQLRECCKEVQPVREDCQCEAIQAIIAEWLDRARQTQMGDYQRVLVRTGRISFSCDLRAQCLAQTFLF
ncbi:2S seed storage albumin protein-like [Ricinus communis]|uniref:2S seed storage albumin protein-like n=1 Tax=Ricinus communis TaxID=3988 RepID=UPI00201AC25B|nr:2S seed storage albumin protein-like [Ricinus communis]